MVVGSTPTGATKNKREKNMTISTLLRTEIENKEQQLKFLKEKLKIAKGNEFFVCNFKGCGAKTQVKKVSLVKGHQYVQPFSCAGGDYHIFERYYTVCPKCGNWSNDWNKETDSWAFIEDHIEQFFETLDCYSGNRDSNSLEDLRKEAKERSQKQDVY